MRERMIVAVRIAFTYIGTVVGAGFASGQETMQFFTLFGSEGMWGIALCIFLFSIIGTRIMIMGHRLGATSYQEFNDYVFGKRWGEWVNVFIGFSLFGITSAMMAGVGSLFEEQLGLSFHVGVIGTIILSLFTLHRGMEGLISVNTFVVPIMFLFMMVVFLFSWNTIRMDAIGNIPPVHHGSWLLSTLSYVAFNVALSQAVLIPLGAQIKDERSIRIGGWLAGIALGLMLIACDLVFLQNLEIVSNMEIPMAYVVGCLGEGIKILFLLVVWGEIFTTLVGNIYGLTQCMEEAFPYRRSLMMFVLFLFSYACSLIGFPSLVGSLYPFLGYCGIFLIFCLLLKRVPAAY